MKKEVLFEGLKVVELASVLAGPAVGMFFSELGAEVVKVENPITNGDVTRSWVAETEKDQQQSAYYSSVNYKKKVLWADLNQPDSFNEVLLLIATADILIVNFKPSFAKRLGLDATSLCKRFPKLIYAQISGYGELNERAAFDVVLQAEAGFMYMNGQVDGPPIKMPIALIDVLAAHQLKEAVLIALLERYKTGLGSFVHVSLYASALASLANQATNYLMGGKVPQRMGSLHPNIAPYGESFLTKDAKEIVLAVGNDAQFQKLCDCLQIKDLARSSLYVTNKSRLQNRKSLAENLSNAFLRFDRDVILSELKIANVPAAAIQDLSEVLNNNTAKEYILTETLEDGQITKRMATAVFDIVKNQI